jgi:hypothetical protein
MDSIKIEKKLYDYTFSSACTHVFRYDYRFVTGIIK